MKQLCRAAWEQGGMAARRPPCNADNATAFTTVAVGMLYWTGPAACFASQHARRPRVNNNTLVVKHYRRKDRDSLQHS